MTTTETRWDRLERDIRAAGIDCTLYHSRGVYSPKHGYSEITVTEGDRKIIIKDQWWSKNIDVWCGWHLYAEDREGITLGRPTHAMKKRSEVVTALGVTLRNLDSL